MSPSPSSSRVSMMSLLKTSNSSFSIWWPDKSNRPLELLVETNLKQTWIFYLKRSWISFTEIDPPPSWSKMSNIQVSFSCVSWSMTKLKYYFDKTCLRCIQICGVNGKHVFCKECINNKTCIIDAEMAVSTRKVHSARIVIVKNSVKFTSS